VNGTAQNIGDTASITGAYYPTGTSSGSPAVKYFVVVTVPNTFLYDITVSATVAIASPSGMTDPSTNPNSGSATTTTNAGTSVVVNLGTTSNGVGFYPGNSLDLTFTVDNTSNSALSAATITLTDSSSALNGTYTWSCVTNCSMTSGTGTTSPTFSMAKNKIATIKVTVTPKTTTTSAFSVTGTLSVGVGFSNSGTKTQTITTGSVSGSGAANITVSIDDNGVTTYGTSQTINYDVTITNNSTTYGFYGGTLTIAIDAGTNNIDTSAMPTAQCTTNCIDSTVYSPTVSSSAITISNLKVDLGKSGSGSNVQKIRLTMKTNSNANNLKGTTTGNATIYYLTGLTDSSNGTSKAASPAATAISQYEVDLGVTYSGTAPTTYTPGNTVTLTFQVKNNSTSAVTGVKLSDLLTIGNVVAASGSSYQCGTMAGSAVCTNGSTANMPTTATAFGPYTAGATNVTPIGTGKTIDLPGSATLIITIKIATSTTQNNALVYTLNAAVPTGYTDTTTSNNSLTQTVSAVPPAITGGAQASGSCSSSGNGANKVNAVSFNWPTQYWPNTGSAGYPTNAVVKYQITINGLSATVTNGGGSASLATGKGTTVTITATASTTTLAFTALPASYNGQQVTVKIYDPSNSATLLTTSSTIGTFTSC
jgi:membrane-bound inhibitor of C-type lysozyme